VGRYGQSILTIAGTVIGAYFGYPALGAALGSLAGSLLFPPKLPGVSGPKLSDIGQTSSTVGVSIPQIWGTIAVTGTVIHQSDLSEVTTSDDVGGGSGGPSQNVETTTYFQSFAIGLCDCPREPIAGLRRIWANGKPIYDRTPQRSDESTTAFQKRMAANDQLEQIMTIYYGTDDQEPDPTFEAFYGVGNVSAHLNLAYVVFTGWENKVEDGQRMPAQWKFEIYTRGASDAGTQTEYSNEVIYPWLRSSGSPADVTNYRNDHEVVVLGNGFSTSPGGTFLHVEDAIEAMYELRVADNPNAVSPSFFNGYEIIGAGRTREQGGPGVEEADASMIKYHLNAQQATSYSLTFDGGAGVCAQLAFLMPGDPPLQCHTNGVGFFASSSNMRVVGTQDAGAGAGVPSGWEWMVNQGGVFGSCSPVFSYIASEDYEVRIQRKPRAPDNPCEPRQANPLFPVNPPCVDAECVWCVTGGRIRYNAPWTFHDTGDPFGYAVLQKVLNDVGDSGLVELVKYPLNPVLPNTDPRFGFSTFWVPAYQRAVAAGLMEPGLFWPTDYPVFQTWAYKRDIPNLTIEVFPVVVGDIVRDLLLDSGYALDQIDVSDLMGLEVIGYSRTHTMTARAAIDPLRQARFFDGYESGRTVKFARRGGQIRKTYVDDELGVMLAGDSNVTKVSTKNAQDVDLPRSVRVHYMSVARDYEPGEQQSPARLETGAVNDLDVELAIAMEDTDAKQIAQVLWADAWASRYSHEITVDAQDQHLEPTDCIGVPVDGAVQRCRILDITDLLPTSRRFSLVRDDDGSYQSYAVADSPTIIPRPPVVFAPIEMIALDIPLIRDQDDAPGFYVATLSQLEGEFNGGSIYRSTDGGGNFTKVLQATTEATVGTLQGAVAAGAADVIDGVTTITVQLQSGDLSSITQAAMYAGGAGSNAAAIGRHGSWEIIQFQDVEDLGDGLFRLSTLLRGRRGTEWAVGTAEDQDRFVLLTGAGVYRVPLQLQELGREYLYRAVAVGLTLDSTADVLFTCAGVCLKPFSPVFIRGDRSELTGDWSVTWIRRGRVGASLASGTDIPLSEETEDYEVVILDQAGDEIRVISTIDPAATYTAAQQITDFGAVIPEDLTVNIYQISAAVGRGYVGTETLDNL
jgi:hypothetical protein